MALTGTVGSPVLPWPATLPRRADPSVALAVVRLWVRSALELDCSQRGDPLLILAGMAGAEVRREPLYAAEGGERALLIPRPNGGFAIVIDPAPGPYEGGAAVQSVQRLRLAHELAHLAFFDVGTPPRRSTSWTPVEEAWCDQVAAELVALVDQPSAAPAA